MKTKHFIIWLILFLLSTLACNFPGLAENAVPPTAIATIPLTPTSPVISETLPPTTAPVYQPRFEAAPCKFEVPEGYEPECGYVIVPEDRSQPDGAQVRLHVARFRATGSATQPDPVFHLSGGPGSPALDLTWYYFQYGMAGVLEYRDYVIFDQRGTGMSLPGLHCPERDNLTPVLLVENPTIEEALEIEMQAYTACRDRLRSLGVDLSMYTSAASAADINDIRIALGYDNINLYGVSYGSRLALTVMRDNPDILRSVILDSTYPPQVNLYTGWPTSAERAFNELFAACAAGSTCNNAYPDLPNMLYSTAEQLNANPVAVPVTDPYSGVTHDVLLTGDILLDVVFVGLYPPFFIARLPQLINEVNSGVYDNLLPGRLELYFNRKGSSGLRNSVQCSEEVPFNPYEEVLASAASIQPEVLRTHFTEGMRGIYEICDVWDVQASGEQENRAVSSDVPTLILAGQLDPITPPVWGEASAETLPNSSYVEIPGAGHWLMRSGVCPLRIGLLFLNDPYSAPDISCVGGLSGPQFTQ